MLAGALWVLSPMLWVAFGGAGMISSCGDSKSRLSRQAGGKTMFNWSAALSAPLCTPPLVLGDAEVAEVTSLFESSGSRRRSRSTKSSMAGVTLPIESSPCPNLAPLTRSATGTCLVFLPAVVRPLQCVSLCLASLGLSFMSRPKCSLLLFGSATFCGRGSTAVNSHAVEWRPVRLFGNLKECTRLCRDFLVILDLGAKAASVVFFGVPLLVCALVGNPFFNGAIGGLQPSIADDFTCSGVFVGVATVSFCLVAFQCATFGFLQCSIDRCSGFVS